MSTIIGRTAFLEETALLFTDERVANARAKVIEWFNETATGDAPKKCESLVKIQECILNSCIELLEEFLENILSLGHDVSQEVRKAVVGFIEHICKSKIEFLPRIVGSLAMLLRDDSPQVMKRVIQACCSVYKNAVQWICSLTDIPDSVEQAWNTLSLMKAQVLDLIDHDNDGVRTNAVKFLEVVIIVQTYPDEDSMKRENDFSLDDVPMTLKLLRRRKLEDEAMNIFDALLKFHAAVHISSVNLIACTGSLCTIAKLRPSLMNPVIEALRKLHSNLPPTLTDSQVNSVRKHLKMQLLNLLRNKASYEMHPIIIPLLQDLSASQQEINRAIPKMDKNEQSRRLKRTLENAALNSSKRARLDEASKANELRPVQIDYDVLQEQKIRSTRVNEKFIAENIKHLEVVIQLVMVSMKNLPNDVPAHFLNNYTAIRDMSLSQLSGKIANLLGEQMSDMKIGPGANCFSREPPMKAAEKEPILITTPIQKELIEDLMDEDDEPIELAVDNNQRKEEATKKLRETIERAKEEQALVQRMKMRAKTFKLQEITQPLSRSMKEQFMVDAIKRILRGERQCIIAGASARRRKILTVVAATFPDNCREIIMSFLMEDIKTRIDLAFSWLYEEYCLLQGFTRHSYVKSEHSPDYDYNRLLVLLIKGVREKCEFKDRILLLRRLFLEAPLLPEEAISNLINICESDENMTLHILELIKDLVVRRPPRKNRLLKILLTYCVHDNHNLREKSLENVILLYTTHKVVNNKIEEFALQWLNYLEEENPPAVIFVAEFGRSNLQEGWTEDMTKICLSLFLSLLPYREEFLQNLSKVYTATSADIKRTILRSIDAAIKKMGPESTEILRLIEQCPKGVETLITRIIYILTERATPTPELVTRVRDLYQTKVTDARLLIPVLGGLTKKEIIMALPKFLKLNPIVVKEVFNRLLGVGSEFSNQNMPITPSEVLVALHNIDNTKCELKFVVKATSICLAEKDIYTQDVLATCLQQLVEMIPLPVLLMRTVIQSLTLYPRLGAFVVNLLNRLILKQVWKQKIIWDGFLKCCQRLKPQSLPVLMQLPGPQLQDALNQCPDLRQPLVEYAQSITDSQVGQISQQTMDILTGNSQDVFVTDESGGYIHPENIKKEKEDPAFPTVGQPLPPGED